MPLDRQIGDIWLWSVYLSVFHKTDFDHNTELILLAVSRCIGKTVHCSVVARSTADQEVPCLKPTLA